MSIFDASSGNPGADIVGNQTSGDLHLGLYDNFNMATPNPYKGLSGATPTADQGGGAWDY